jgi:electron transfer flavoprotein beta subunit
MNILVCLSSVPDTTSKINFNNNNQEFDLNGVSFVINPYDEFCLTKAVLIKEKDPTTSITVINVGEPMNDSILRKALAIGADKAVRINIKATHGQMVTDSIANYCNDNQFDIIFCGR